MTPGDSTERRANFKSQLIERLHDPLQLRIIVIGTVMALGYVAVYTPLQTAIRASQRNLDRERKLAHLAVNIEHLRDQCKSFSDRLPNTSDSKEWMQYMLDGIRSCPIKLNRLDFAPPRKIGPYPMVVMKLQVEGSYYELDEFLRWLETNTRLLRTDEINISLAPKKEQQASSSKNMVEANKDDMLMTLTVLGLAS